MTLYKYSEPRLAVFSSFRFILFGAMVCFFCLLCLRIPYWKTSRSLSILQLALSKRTFLLLSSITCRSQVLFYRIFDLYCSVAPSDLKKKISSLSILHIFWPYSLPCLKSFPHSLNSVSFYLKPSKSIGLPPHTHTQINNMKSTTIPKVQTFYSHRQIIRRSKKQPRIHHLIQNRFLLYWPETRF